MIHALCFLSGAGFIGAATWFWLAYQQERAQRAQVRRVQGRVSGPRHRFFASRRMSPREMADFLDLVGLALSAGLSLRDAWRRALEFLPDGYLRRELERTLKAVSVGQSWEAAFARLKERLDPSWAGVLALMKRSITGGSALEATLQTYADDVRTRLMMQWERSAQTAGVRLLFPLVFLIFPAVFIVILGPIVITLLSGQHLF
jgi:tight adherence protein C